MAFPTGWINKHRITFDYTKVSGAANLTNYPALLTEANFLADAFSNSQGKEINTNYLLNDANLKAYWRLEDLLDETANSFDLTNNGTTTFDTAKFTNGMQQGTSNSTKYLSINNDLGITTGDITVSMWVKINTAPSTSTQELFQHGDSGTDIRHMIRYSESAGVYTLAFNRQKENIANQQVTYTINLGTSGFFHLAYVYDSTNIKGYVNGVLIGSIAASGSGASGVDIDYTYIGAGRSQTPAVNNYASALIDDVAIFNRALSDAEIKTIYTGGTDIRFSTDEAGTTQIAHEIVNWDIVNSEAEVWVKIPTLSYTANTNIYVWYNNDTAIPLARTDTYGSNNVWDANYIGVWHDGGVADSTTSGYNLTATNSPTLNATGKINVGTDYEAGSSQYSTIADASVPNLEISGSQTFQLWLKPETLTSYQSVMAKSKSDNTVIHQLLVSTDSGNIAYFTLTGLTTNAQVASTATLTNGAWSFLAGRYNSSDTTLALIIDVTKASVTASGATTDTNGDFTVGRNGSQSAFYFDGVVDEARVSNIARSDGWLATEYANQNAPATFATASAITSFIPQAIWFM